MNLAECPWCGTEIDLHNIPPGHWSPDGEECEFQASGDWGTFLEDNEVCVRCGLGPADSLEYIGDGYYRHEPRCPGGGDEGWEDQEDADVVSWAEDDDDDQGKDDEVEEPQPCEVCGVEISGTEIPGIPDIDFFTGSPPHGGGSCMHCGFYLRGGGDGGMCQVVVQDPDSGEWVPVQGDVTSVPPSGRHGVWSLSPAEFQRLSSRLHARDLQHESVGPLTCTTCGQALVDSGGEVYACPKCSQGVS